VNIYFESPSDVLLVDEADIDLLKGTGWEQQCHLTLDELKQMGNSCFQSNDFEKSLKFYDRVLKLDHANSIINLNRLASLLKLKRYYEAYQVARDAGSEANQEKRLVRLARAAYGMREWKLAINHYTELLHLSPTLDTASTELKLAQDRDEESLTGNYDMRKILELLFQVQSTKQPLFSMLPIM
jgi:tetratricopeptide (TPR) repeat protein